MRDKLLHIWCEALEITEHQWTEFHKSGNFEIDSLTIIKFIIDVEDEFGVKLEDGELLSSEGDVYELVAAKLEESGV